MHVLQDCFHRKINVFGHNNNYSVMIGYQPPTCTLTLLYISHEANWWEGSIIQVLVPGAHYTPHVETLP